MSSFASNSNIGVILDNASYEIETFNSEWKSLFDKNNSREYLEQLKLGKVVSILENSDLSA